MFKESNNFKKFESKVWLSSPTMHGPEIEYVKEAYETNWMSTVGKNINEVERLACEYIGCKHAVALSAGTASLHLSMKLAGIAAYGMPKVGHGALEGKKVFCSDMTFDATVNPIVYEGGEPVFIDTEYDTWNMDPIALEKAFEFRQLGRIICGRVEYTYNSTFEQKSDRYVHSKRRFIKTIAKCHDKRKWLV